MSPQNHHSAMAAAEFMKDTPSVGNLARCYIDLKSQMELQAKQFNAAINFAADKAGLESDVFLRMWREGDWEGLKKEWPEFTGPVPSSNDDQDISNGLAP